MFTDFYTPSSDNVHRFPRTTLGECSYSYPRKIFIAYNTLTSENVYRLLHSNLRKCSQIVTLPIGKCSQITELYTPRKRLTDCYSLYPQEKVMRLLHSTSRKRLIDFYTLYPQEKVNRLLHSTPRKRLKDFYALPLGKG